MPPTPTSTVRDGRAVFDFDAYFADKESKEPIVFRLYDQDWDLGTELPASIALRVAEWHAAGQDGRDLTTSEILLLATEMIPAPVLEAWKAKGIGMEQLCEVLLKVLALHMENVTPSAPVGPQVPAPPATYPGQGPAGWSPVIGDPPPR